MADDKIPHTRASDPGDLSLIGVLFVWMQRLSPILVILALAIGFRVVTPSSSYNEVRIRMMENDSINRAQDARLQKIETDTERNMQRIEQKVDVLIRFRCRDLPLAERSTYLFCD